MKLVSIVCLLVPSLAVAQDELADDPELSVSVVDTLTGEARLDNANGRPDDDNFGLFLNRLNLSANTPSVVLGARLDTVVYADTPTTSAFSNDVRLERASAELRLGDATLLVGDGYRQLGRGILLSLRKVDEVGLDLALRGADFRYAPEGHGFSAFAGVVNTTNIDIVSARAIDDTGDVLAGGSYELSAIEGVTLGLNALYLQPSERLLDTLDYTISGGATAELPELVEGLSLYGELAVQNRRLAGGTELGTAAYVTADWSSGDLTVLLEGLRLDAFEERGSRNTALGSRFDYNVPPTLERIDQEVFNSINVTGGRARVELAWLDADLITYANAMVRVNDPGADNELLQLHGYAGGEYRFEEHTSKIALSGGARDERTSEGRLKSMIHFEADVVKTIVTGWAIHLSSTNELRTLAERSYARGSSFLGAEWAGHGSLTVEVGYDTQDPSPDVRSLFVAGILAIDFSDVIRMRTNVGTQRGGLKCVAGVCREFPAFAGVRSEIVIRL